MNNPESDAPPDATGRTNPDSRDAVSQIRKRVVSRAGGRHLVFRVRGNRVQLMPRPRTLISNIEGALFFFYGIGQVWISHRKLRRINGWLVRAPRFGGQKTVAIVDQLEAEITDFIDQMRQFNLIGSLVIERQAVEFHWTVPARQKHETDIEIQKRQSIIDMSFNRMATAFAQLQLAGSEGIDDTPAADIHLQTDSDNPSDVTIDPMAR